jgi:acyl-CoA reductase-like NAD-dependent aldehyde dehydrogenase
MPPTPVSDIKPTHERLRHTFDAGVTRVVSWRYAQLRGIERMMVENRGAFIDALHKDLRKPTFEGNVHEVETVLSEVRFAISHLASWMAPEAVTTPSPFLPASSYIVKDPVGVVCIITAWNYPISAFARRNCNFLALLS